MIWAPTSILKNVRKEKPSFNSKILVLAILFPKHSIAIPCMVGSARVNHAAMVECIPAGLLRNQLRFRLQLLGAI